MTDWPILSTITFLPLVGAFFILLIRGDEATAANNAKAVALWTSVATLFLTGFMVSQLLSPRPYYSQPIYTSYSPYSPFRSKWVTADGYVFDGDIRKRNYKVSPSVYKPKPTVTRTVSRGGFGSSVRAKSSWGSSSRSGSWGS